HPRKRVIAAEILRTDADKKSGIRVDAVAGTAAHSICHDTALLAGRRHHFSSGTHTEGVHAPTSRQVHSQLIIGGPKLRVARKTSVLRAIDRLLQMFNACAKGKRL